MTFFQITILYTLLHLYSLPFIHPSNNPISKLFYTLSTINTFPFHSLLLTLTHFRSSSLFFLASSRRPSRHCAACATMCPSSVWEVQLLTPPPSTSCSSSECYLILLVFLCLRLPLCSVYLPATPTCIFSLPLKVHSFLSYALCTLPSSQCPNIYATVDTQYLYFLFSTLFVTQCCLFFTLYSYFCQLSVAITFYRSCQRVCCARMACGLGDYT